MNPIDRYFHLVQEFEQSLNRELTDREEDFIIWMVEQEIKTKRLGTKSKALVLC